MPVHRMFSNQITQSARFLRMPPTSRLLYYDLGMAADDDGVVEAFATLRMTGATEDDLRVLVSKGFIKVLNDDLVTLILDWRVNNILKADRYKPSIYTPLLVQIGAAPEPIRNHRGTRTEPIRNRTGTETEPQAKLSKAKLSQAKLNHQETTPAAVEEVEPFDSPNVYQAAPDPLILYATSNLTTLNPRMLEELISYRDVFTDEMIREAIDDTLRHGSRAYAYTHSILERWQNAGYRTIAEVKAADDKRKAATATPAVKPGKPMLSRDVTEDEFDDSYSDILNRRHA